LERGTFQNKKEPTMTLHPSQAENFIWVSLDKGTEEVQFSLADKLPDKEGKINVKTCITATKDEAVMGEEFVNAAATTIRSLETSMKESGVQLGDLHYTSVLKPEEDNPAATETPRKSSVVFHFKVNYDELERASNEEDCCRFPLH